MQTADLFPLPEVTRARAKGHAMGDLAAEKTERVVDPDWCAKAVEALRKFAAGQAGLFTLEMARGVIEAQGDLARPSDGRTWGKATVMAIQQGYLRPTTTYFPAASSNGSVKRCYARGARA